MQDVTDIGGPFDEGQHDGKEYASSSTNGKKYELVGHSKRFGSFQVLQDLFDTALSGKIWQKIMILEQRAGVLEDKAVAGQDG